MGSLAMKILQNLITDLIASLWQALETLSV